MRPHEALDGETPAERYGIKIKGQNKWLMLIQNASEKDCHEIHKSISTSFKSAVNFSTHHFIGIWYIFI